MYKTKISVKYYTLKKMSQYTCYIAAIAALAVFLGQHLRIITCDCVIANIAGSSSLLGAQLSHPVWLWKSNLKCMCKKHIKV